MMNVFHKTFKDKFSIINNIFYLNLENKDIISINNQAQNTIFIGNINNENYSFNINYILDFLTYETLKSAIQRVIPNATINMKCNKEYITELYFYLEKNLVPSTNSKFSNACKSGKLVFK